MDWLKEWWKDIVQVLSDLILRAPQFWELGLFEFRTLYLDSRLGMVWAALSPLTQIGVYWFVFGIGIRSRSDIDGFPYIVWLTCGVSGWNLFTRGIMAGASELRSKVSVISKVNIPPYMVLASKMISILLDHVWLLLLMTIIMLSNGWRPDGYAFCLVYYICAALCFMAAFSMISSVLTLLAADFRRVLEMVIRLFFFLTPIIWIPGDGMPLWFNVLQAWSPARYIVVGYRDCLLYHTAFWSDLADMARFWGLTILLFIIGCKWQCKIRNQLADHSF